MDQKSDTRAERLAIMSMRSTRSMSEIGQQASSGRQFVDLYQQYQRITQAYADARKIVKTLTPREKETLSFITAGLSSKAIARKLEISPRTVEVFRKNAFRKINAFSTADAVRIGIYAGLDLQCSRRPAEQDRKS